jgi:hypothetical protein
MIILIRSRHAMRGSNSHTERCRRRINDAILVGDKTARPSHRIPSHPIRGRWGLYAPHHTPPLKCRATRTSMYSASSDASGAYVSGRSCVAEKCEYWSDRNTERRDRTSVPVVWYLNEHGQRQVSQEEVLCHDKVAAKDLQLGERHVGERQVPVNDDHRLNGGR